MRVGPGLVSTVVLTAVMVAPAAAQPALDRVLGNAPSGLPFTVAGQWPQLVGSLARATGVPIGVESVNLSLVPPVGTRLTGLTLRDALDTLAREAGYEWREMDGVIVLRPRRAWVALSHPLDIEVEPVDWRRRLRSRRWQWPVPCWARPTAHRCPSAAGSPSRFPAVA